MFSGIFLAVSPMVSKLYDIVYKELKVNKMNLKK